MKELMSFLFEISLYSSVLILTTFLIKVIFKDRVNIKIVIILWMIVLVRLIMPFTLTSPFHLDRVVSNAFNPEESNTELTESVYGEKNNDSINQNTISEPDITNSNQIPKDENVSELAALQPEINSKLSFGEYITSNIWTILFTIWISGFIIFFFEFLYKLAKFNIYIKKSRYIMSPKVREIFRTVKKDLKINKSVELLSCRYINVPVAFGVMSPKILLPMGLGETLSEDKIKLVLMHELYHIKRNDLLKNYIWILVKLIHWFNPLIWLAYREYSNDNELAVDNVVIKRAGRNIVYEYSQSIIDVIKLSKSTIKIPITVSFCEDKIKLRKRVENMIKQPKKQKTVGFFSMIFAFIMVIACFTTACQPTPEDQAVQNKNDDELMEAINNTAEPTTDESTAASAGESAQDYNSEKSVFEFASTKTVSHVIFDLELADKNIYLTADADVTMPDVETLPVYSYKRKDLNQDTVNNIFDALLGDKPFYEYIEGDGRLTKSQIENYIVAINYDLKDLSSLGALYRGAESEDDLKRMRDEELEYYYGLLEDAPVEPTLIEQSKFLSDDYVIGWASINDDYMAEVRIIGTERGMDVEDVQSIGVSYSMIGFYGDVLRGRLSYIMPYDGTITETTAAGGPFISEIEGQPETIQMTPEEAIEIAERTFKEMGAGDDVQVANIYYVDIPKFMGFDQMYCYGIELKRCIENVPIQINHSSKIGAQQDNSDFSNQFTRAVPFEEMTIFINDLGIIDLLWREPIETVELLNNNVSLVSTDEVIEEFKKQFLYSYSYAAAVEADSLQGKLEYSLYNIDLSYSLARIPNQNDVFMAIPLWEFYSTVPMLYYDRDMNPITLIQYENLLTINAVDKSRFVHQWGY